MTPLPQFSTCGVVAGLALAIVLIVRRTPPVYALLFGALAGALLGGGGFAGATAAMVKGAQGMSGAILRVLASGVLVGALVRTGAAARLADGIVRMFGPRFAMLSVAMAAAVICAAGVFADIAVLTVAPVALAAGRMAHLPAPALMLALVGGAKAGNIVSPNPNTLAVADAFHVDLLTLMGANLPAALAALALTVAFAWMLGRHAADRSALRGPSGGCGFAKGMPSLSAAWAGPLTVLALLAARPLLGLAVDPVVALPIGGIVAVVAGGRLREMVAIGGYGLAQVTGIVALLVGVGAMAGVIGASGLCGDTLDALTRAGLPPWALAPVAGALLSGVTASSTASATIAAQTFGADLLTAGISARAAATSINAASVVFSSLPQGSFFHATAAAVGMTFRARCGILPYEMAVGATGALVACLCG